MRLYTSVDPVAVLGCTERTLLSNSTDGKDTAPLDLVTHLKVKSHTLGLEWSEMQIPIVQRLLYTLAYTAVSQAANSLNGNGLLATSYVQYNMSPGLPSNQWQLELMNWLSASLNALQTFTVQYVIGYGSEDGSSTNSAAPSESEKWMCDRQIVNRDDYSSFSVLGLAVLIIVSGCIILANISTRRFVSRRLRTAKRKKPHLKTLWDSFDILNLKAEEDPEQSTATIGRPGFTATEKGSKDRDGCRKSAVRICSKEDLWTPGPPVDATKI
jgi:hypothetical protein